MTVYAHASNIYAFYIGECLLGVGLSFTSTSMVGCVVRRTYSENTGKIMGTILAANGLGGALAAQIVTPIIFEEGNPFGNRNAYKLIVVILTVTAIIVLTLVREKDLLSRRSRFPPKKTRTKLDRH